MDSTVARNIENFKRFQYEVAVKGDFTDLDKLMTPEILVHRPANTSLLQMKGVISEAKPMVWSAEDFKKNWKVAMAGRRDHQRHVDEIYGVDNVIWARWSISWTHSEPVEGIPATGRKIHINETGIMKYDDAGRMKEGWFMADQLELFLAIGADVTLTPKDADT